jgi:HK97 family phage portal protein
MISLKLPRLTREVEAKDLQFIPIDAGLHGHLPRTAYSYGRDVGEGFDSNVVMAPVMWVMRTFTEAKAIVETDRETPDIWRKHRDHPVEVLIDKPNPFYDGDTLWKATCISYVLNGNAYWRKIRNRFGDVVQLWYTPHWLLEPKWPQDGSEFISHYEYRPIEGRQPIRMETRDVVHFRFGLDPRNPRLGLSPLKCLLREVFVDDEAANFSAKLLENMGVAGMVISPESSENTISDKELDKFKAYVRTHFTGDNRGSALITGIPTRVNQYGFNPSMMTLGDTRDITEERVCAVIGIPAAIVGFGSGMQATKVGATMRELVKMAWVGCLTPTQHTMGRQITDQLLPDFVSQTRRFRASFDTSQVEVFEEDAAALVGKVTNMVQQGVLRIDRAQEMLGLEVDPKMDVYLRPSNSVPVDKEGNVIQAAAPNGAVGKIGGGGEEEAIPAAVLARRNGNGNGTKPEED